MPISTATVPTDRAGRYLAQLCRHFAQKIDAHIQGAEGFADFGWGTCKLTATHASLLLRGEADEADQLARIEHVVRDHVERFGRRDGLQVQWNRQTV